MQMFSAQPQYITRSTSAPRSVVAVLTVSCSCALPHTAVPVILARVEVVLGAAILTQMLTRSTRSPRGVAVVLMVSCSCAVPHTTHAFDGGQGATGFTSCR